MSTHTPYDSAIHDDNSHYAKSLDNADLLDVLESILSDAEYGSGRDELFRNIASKARAAIARAKGQS